MISKSFIPCKSSVLDVWLRRPKDIWLSEWLKHCDIENGWFNLNTLNIYLVRARVTFAIQMNVNKLEIEIDLHDSCHIAKNVMSQISGKDFHGI